MDRLLNILNDSESNFDVKLEKKDKLTKKKVSNIRIEPVFKVKDDYSEPPHEHLLRLPFSILEIAPKGSGKTTLLQNLIMWYHKYFDNIFIFSPTLNLDVKWKLLVEKLNLPPENLFTEYKEAEVSNIMNQIKDYNMNKENKDKLKCLMIFDDIIDSLPKNKKKCALNKLAFNHRHYNISHIIISQSYKKIDCNVRANTTGMILFNTDNTAERTKIIEELAGNIGRKEFERLWYDCVKEKYGFMYLNYDVRKIYKNFEEEIADLDIMPTLLYDKLNEGNVKKK